MNATAKTLRSLGSLILAITFSSVTVSNVSATPRLVVGTIRGFPGATVEIPLSLRYASNDLRNVVALQGDVVFDGALAAAGTETSGTALRGHQLRSSQPAVGTLRLLAYALDNALMSNGIVATVPFTIPAGARSNVRLSLENVILSDANGNSVPVIPQDGAILIQRVYVRPADGNVEGYFSGLQDQAAYVVQATTNFATWVNVMTNSPADSLLEFLDMDAHLYPYRFYRPMPVGGAVGEIARLDGTQLTLRLLGVAGRTYVVQASTNLNNWVDLSTNVAGPRTLVFTNTIDPMFPHRFFRLKSD